MASETNNETKSNKIYFTIGIAIIIIVVAVVGTNYFLIKSLLPSLTKQPAATESKSSEIGPIIEAGEFIVNLNDPEASPYLKTKVTIELTDTKNEATAKAREAIIRNDIINILRSKTLEDVTQSDSMVNLAKEITKTLNEKTLPGMVKNVYFSDFVVQK